MCGETMPYLGYIRVNVTTSDIHTENNNDCLMLVVPTTEYSQKVPVIIGTNFIHTMMNCIQEQRGQRFIQTTRMTTPWLLAFRYITIRENKLSRNKNRLGVVKSAETDNIIIPPNSEVNINGYIDREVPYHPVCAFLQSTYKSLIPQDLDIAPSLISYKYQNNNNVVVKISNVTARPVKIPPKALLCEIQPVVIEEEIPKPNFSNNSDDIMNLVKISTTASLQHDTTE